MPRPRFTTREFLASTLSISAGLGCWTTVRYLANHHHCPPLPAEPMAAGAIAVLFFLAGALIGAGLLAPFHATKKGALLGFVYWPALWLWLSWIIYEL